MIGAQHQDNAARKDAYLTKDFVLLSLKVYNLIRKPLSFGINCEDRVYKDLDTQLK